MPASRDCFCVSTEPLAAVVNSYAARWREQHQPFSSRTPQLRFDSVLGGWAGLPARQVQRVMYREQPTTPLAVADAIVTALGQPELLSDDETLGVRPNPRAPRSCCGGSLTGVA